LCFLRNIDRVSVENPHPNLQVTPD